MPSADPNSTSLRKCTLSVSRLTAAYPRAPQAFAGKREHKGGDEKRRGEREDVSKSHGRVSATITLRVSMSVEGTYHLRDAGSPWPNAAPGDPCLVP